MNLLRHHYRSWIVPYAEGTLDARRRARLEAWLAHDPILAAEAEAERRVVARLRDAAQTSEDTSDGRNLWPGIQSRLGPRRSHVRPLILVGGLSAAATSLAWAALWGPLHHSAPSLPHAQVAAAGPPSIIVLETMPDREHGHPGRRFRHGGGHPAKRLAAPLPRLERGLGLERPEIPDESRTAYNGAPKPTGDGDTTVSTPNSSDTARFHLATSVQPTGNRNASADVPPEQNTASRDASDTPGVEDSADKNPHLTDSATEASTLPAVTPGQVPSARKSTRRHERRHNRRHSSRPSGGKAAANASVGMGTPVGDTTAHPKDPTKPID